MRSLFSVKGEKRERNGAILKQVNRAQGSLYQAGALLLLFLAALVVVPSLLLPLRIPVGVFSFVLSAVLALAVYVLLAGVSKQAVRNAFIACAVVALALVFSGMVLDMSYDGIAYQKTAVGALKNGWNPWVQSVEDWAQAQPLRSGYSHYGLWVDHYPRGTWYIGAAFYAVTGNIECGKAYTLIMMAALFCLLGDFLYRYGLKRWQALLVAALAAVNPITLAQFTTFYNDALLMLCLFIIVMLLAELFFGLRRDTFILLFAALAVGCGIKFTGLAYCFVFCAAYLAVLLFLRLYRLEKVKPLLVPAAVIVGGIALVTLVGGPYLSNLLDHGNPLYPLAGAGSIDIISSSEPAAFAGQPSFVKVFYALFSYSENLMAYTIADPQLRIPFVLATGELAKLDTPDLRIGGFGPFFGPVLVVSLVILAVFTVRYFKTNKTVFSILATSGVVVAGLMLLIPESWWARYSGYLYGAVIVALALCLKQLNQTTVKRWRLWPVLGFAALVAINAALFTPVGRLQRAAGYRHEIEALKTLSAQNEVVLYLGDGTAQFTGLIDDFIDSGVRFSLVAVPQPDMAPALDGVVHYRLQAIEKMERAAHGHAERRTG